MTKIRVEIEGVTPMLMNRFNDESEAKVASGVSAVNQGDRGTPRSQAEKTAYRNGEGELYIPTPNLFRAIIDAGKYHKAGKSKVTTVKSSLVPAGIALEGLTLPLGTKEFAVDSRSVVIPATGGRIMRHRARLDHWRLVFVMEVDTEIFSLEFTRTLIEDAGKRIGLGDYRPDRKGPFGKFKVTDWQEIKL